jgi:hypothetical protein
MGKNNNTVILIIIVVAVLGLLWYLNRSTAKSNEGEMYVPDSDMIKHVNEHFNNNDNQNNIVSNAVVERVGSRLLGDFDSGLKGPGLNDIDLNGGVFEGDSNLLAGVTNEDIDNIVNERSQKQLEFNNSDLLPQEVNKDWFESDFSNARIRIGNDNLINTDRFTIGVNTVGQSLKNPSYDLRPSPPCPKITVSPWNQSTIEPDYNIKPWY